jgi:hypothetical protein
MPPEGLPITAEQQTAFAAFIADWILYGLPIVLAFIFKESIQDFVAGVRVFWGSDLNQDDVLVLDGRPARVVRVGLSSTSFYLYRIDDAGVFRNGTRQNIANSKLIEHTIEKPLPLFDPVLTQLYKDINLKPARPLGD